MNNSLEHDPEKWEPVFGQDHAENEESSARGHQPGVAYGTPSSNFRSRRRSRSRGQGRLGKAVYHLLHRRRDVWPSVIGAIHDRAVSA
jgi:hypothetical protein